MSHKNSTVIIRLTTLLVVYDVTGVSEVFSGMGKLEPRAIVTVYVISFLWTILQELSDRLVTLKRPTVLHNPACTVAIVSRVGTGFTAIVPEHNTLVLLVGKVKNFSYNVTCSVHLVRYCDI